MGGSGRYSWADLGARPALFPAISLGIGACLAGTTTRSPSVFLALGAVLLALAALGRGRSGTHVGLLTGLCCAGYGLSTLEARTLVPQSWSPGASVELEGEIEEIVPYDDAVRLTVALSRLAGAPARVRANIYARGSPPLRSGQHLRARARLRPYEAPANPGQADSREALRRRGLLFTGSVERGQWLASDAPSAWQAWLGGTQQRLAARVSTLAPSKEAASLYLTLAAGLRAELGEDLEARFAASGLAHVLSISGLHVAALALMLLTALRWLIARLWRGARRVDARRVAGPVAIPLVWAYVVFTGSQPPAVRSALMASILFLGMALWRRPDSLNSLALAALAVVAFEPSSVTDLSLQLSFLAVLSLVVVSPAARQMLPFTAAAPAEEGRWKHRFLRAREQGLQTLAASLAVTATGLPLIAATFHRLSLAGLVSNIVCLPLCGVLTGLSAGGAALFLIHPTVATPVLWAGGWASQLLVWLVDVFSALPGASFSVPSLSPALGAVYELSLFTFALVPGRWRWVGLGAPAALLAAWVVPCLLPPPALRVSFLSVGHGDAIVLSSAGHHALVDGGGVPGGADTGKRFVLPFLRERGIRALDLAALSHPHPDHALGLVSVLRALPPAHLWVGAGSPGPPGNAGLTAQVAEAAGRAPEEVAVGHAPFLLGQATVEVLGPPPDDAVAQSANDRSIILRVGVGDVSFLLTGDIEGPGEEVLQTPAATVVKAPHHGSRTSSSEAFVSATHPRFVVFCVGRDNRYHFPADEVVERYQRVGARCLRTDLDGEVDFETDGRTVEVRTFLDG
jgi:competence protein ComEC